MAEKSREKDRFVIRRPLWAASGFDWGCLAAAAVVADQKRATIGRIMEVCELIMWK